MKARPLRTHERYAGVAWLVVERPLRIAHALCNPTMAAPSAGQQRYFNVMATGQIESGRFEGNSSLYCRYVFSCGEDWCHTTRSVTSQATTHAHRTAILLPQVRHVRRGGRHHADGLLLWLDCKRVGGAHRRSPAQSTHRLGASVAIPSRPCTRCGTSPSTPPFARRAHTDGNAHRCNQSERHTRGSPNLGQGGPTRGSRPLTGRSLSSPSTARTTLDVRI